MPRPTPARALLGLVAVLRRLWAWLTDSGYKPERHYMRGGGRPRAASGPGAGATGTA